MGKQGGGSGGSGGGGVAVAVVLILVLLAVPCLIAVLFGAYFFVGIRQVAPPVVVAPPMPAPTAVKTVVPMRAVVLTIGADSAMTLDGAAVEGAAIPDRLQQLRSANPNSMLQVIVRADPAAPASAVEGAISTLSVSGAQYIVEPTAGGAPSPTPPLVPGNVEGPPEVEAATEPGSESSPSPETEPSAEGKPSAETDSDTEQEP